MKLMKSVRQIAVWVALLVFATQGVLVTGLPSAHAEAIVTEQPAEPTLEPTAEPTEAPTAEPTAEPTAVPTVEPTAEPTVEPTAVPSVEPTVGPTAEPTAEPIDEKPEEPTHAYLSFAPCEGGLAITGLLEARETVRIPAAIGELPVVAIAEKAFMDCKTLQRVEVSEGVLAIGKSAFEGCEALEWASLPLTLERVDDKAFADCPLVRVDAPAGSYAYAYAEANGLLPVDEPASTDEPAPTDEPASTDETETNDSAPAMVDETAVISFDLKATEGKIGIGEKFNLKSLITNVTPEGAVGSYKYKSSNTKLATVTSKGLVTGVKAGSVITTVTEKGGAARTFTATIAPKPTKVRLSLSKATLGVGEGITLTPKVTPTSAKQTAAFSSSKPAVATVDANGKVTAVSVGKATITAKTYNWLSAACVITVKPKPESIVLDVTELRLATTEAYKLKPTFAPAGAAGTFRYASDNATVATVSASGTIIGVAPGMATITVSTYAEASVAPQTVTVTVLPEPTALTLNATACTIGTGETFKLTVDGTAPDGSKGLYKYTTGNARIATVSSTGSVRGVRAGATIVTVTAQNGVTAQLAVTVKTAPAKVVLSPTKATLGIDQSLALTAKLSPANATGKITYTSSKPSVATVDANGNVTAVGLGKATITATTYNKKKVACVITVKPKPESIAPNKTALELVPTETAAIKPSYVPATAAGAFTYKSNDETIATVDRKGVVTAVAVGETTVTVSCCYLPDVKADVQIKVLPGPESFTLNTGDRKMGVSETLTLAITDVQPAEARCLYTCTSSKKTVATVTKNAKTGAMVVKAVKAGTATITVKALSGAARSFKVTVVAAPTSLAFSKKTARLAAGASMTLTPKFTPKTAGGAITYKSSAPLVASVDERGVVTGLSVGKAKITATMYNKKSTYCTVTVYSDGAIIDSVTPDQSAYTEGDTILWTVAAHGGVTPYAYQYTLKRNGEPVAQSEPVADNTYAYQTPARTGTQTSYGDYALEATVIDASGLSKSKGCTTTVAPKPLAVASLTSEPTAYKTNEPILWTAATDGGKLPISTHFSVWQGETLITEADGVNNQATLQIARAGSYTVKVAATDADQATAEKSVGVTVAVAQISELTLTLAQDYATTGTPFAFSASAKGGDGTLHYRYDILSGDTGETSFAENVTSPYTFETAGVYRIRVTATDEGADTARQTAVQTSAPITAADPLAVATITCDTAKPVINQSVTWTTATTGGQQPLRYTYTLLKGGVAGTPVESGAATYTATLDAYCMYVLRVSVTDAKGATATKDSAAVGFSVAPNTKLVYELTEEGAVITKYFGTEASVAVPAAIDGKPVVRIGNAAFKGNATLTSIVLPNSITVIGEEAFSGCTALSTMNAQ